MTDYSFINQGFQTQDLIRTLNFSFQPYMPFTQQYSMMLQEANDPERANYFRVGPPTPTEEHQDKSSADSSYPFSLRTKLFMGDAGGATGKITAVARNKTRVQEISKTIPDTANASSRLAAELSKLLNADFDSDSFIADNFHAESTRDMHELEVGMFSREIDQALGIGQQVQQGPMRDPSQFVATTQTKQGFDVILSQYNSANAYISSLYGQDYNPAIDAMEVSRGVQEKTFFKIGETQGLTEQQTLQKLIEHINSTIDGYNTKIRAAIAPHLQDLGQAGPLDLIALAEPALLAEAARNVGARGRGKTSSDYMIRQIMHRFALNSFRPYYFQGQLSQDSFAIFTLSPELDGVIPQIALVDDTSVKIETNAGTFKNGMHQFLVNTAGQDSAVVDAAASRASTLAAARSVATLQTLQSVGRYATANVELSANNQLDVTISAEGTGSVHKMSMEISTKMLKDIRAYYSTGKMKGQFKLWYDSMMAAANNLSKSWAKNSQNVFGQRGMPISKEWRSMSSWENVTGYKKKYIGVWNDMSEQAWKGSIGKNFTVAPFLESRRQLSGGLQSPRFTQQ